MLSQFNHYLEMYEEGYWSQEEAINRATEFYVLYVEAIMAEKRITDKSRLQFIENMGADYSAFKDKIKALVA
ncbi:hypothetical protein [Metasolibacillus meyeri]|uniref:hypothetical protein n=1 Tax=Metasolibacillus meyeri TaxID=1071052 RepID=UPI000D2FD3B4|nr:hypothetical protein [Metasolibacillus meyeri]